MTGHLRLSPRVVIAALLSTLAAAFVGWLTLAHGSSPAVDSNTQIKHVVVVFDENESFDHYFGTYPNAANLAGERAFTGTAPDHAVNGLSAALLAPNNPNLAQPQRLAPSQALTCDANHAYIPEEEAFNGGTMDRFVQNTGNTCSLVMDYFDGNTVTGLWNLAQHFTMSDDFFDTTFGPSTPGAINLISGNTHGAVPAGTSGISDGTMISDPDPALDDCGSGPAQMNGTNIGDLMNTRGVTWGWFQGGFRATARSSTGTATCGSAHRNIGGASVADYSAHHEPFMYYASTANPHHLPPTSVAEIGHTDQANHQYDLADFDNAVKADNLPQVSFLKAAAFEDAHPGYSDPLDEQNWISRVVDEVEQSPDWSSTAIVITYDDSDGWYDHVSNVLQGSHLSDNSETAQCTGGGGTIDANHAGRCGPGPRLPLLVISPWVAQNHVDDTDQLEQTSIIRFIEDNWSLGAIGNTSFDARATSLSTLFDFNVGDTRAPKVYLNPSTGQVVSSPPAGLLASPNGADVATTPAGTTTGTTTGTVTPVTTTTTTTTPVRPPVTTTRPVVARIRPKVSSLKYKRSGKKVVLTFKVSGLSAAKGRVTVSARLLLRRKTIASSSSATVKRNRATLTLKARKTIKKAKYTLTFRFRQGTSSATLTRTVSVR